MNVVVISALGNEVARRCIDTLLMTSPSRGFDLHLIRERGTREQTLNHVVESIGTDSDLLLVGDDIEFTTGWYEALRAHHEGGDILGMSMLYPRSRRVQDRGYELVQVDGKITAEAMDRGGAVDRMERFGSRTCDAVCGCFMLIKSHVFAAVPRFREEGRNRWGELIFATEARRHGAKVRVIDHCLYHSGTSSKAHPDPELSSTSYRVEAPLWEEIVRRWVDPTSVRRRLGNIVDAELERRLSRPGQRVLIHGVGTVAELLADRVGFDGERFDFSSGLDEEVGGEFHGHTVRSLRDVDPNDYDWILITPLHRGERLYREAFEPRRRQDGSGGVSAVEVETVGDARVHRCRDLVRSARIESKEAV